MYHSQPSMSPTGPPTTTTTTIDNLHSDILTLVLRHMDGPTLAAASSATPRLRSLSSEPALWLSTWPSLRHPRLLPLLSSPSSFFSQSFPYPNTDTYPILHNDQNAPLPMQLTSCMDLYHKDTPVFSRVIDTDTTSSWFLTSPFRIDGLARKDPNPYPSTEPAIDPEKLTLSWILLTPNARAVNVSSRRPVSVDRHWYTGEILVRFAVVLGRCVASVVVVCEDETGHVREVGMTVEDVDGFPLNGRESLVVLIVR